MYHGKLTGLTVWRADVNWPADNSDEAKATLSVLGRGNTSAEAVADWNFRAAGDGHKVKGEVPASVSAPVSVGEARKEFNARQGQPAQVLEFAHMSDEQRQDAIRIATAEGHASCVGLGFPVTDSGKLTGRLVQLVKARTLKLAGKMRVIPFPENYDTRELLTRCERFISGFEDDETQEGVSELLADLRARIG